MHRDAELECLADARRADARADASPEGRVEQDHVRGGGQRDGRELLEVDHDRIGGQRHAHLLPYPSHPRHAEDGVFQVVVAEALDLLAEPDGCLGRPDAVGVEAEAVAVERGRELAVALQFILRREDAPLQLVRGEAVLPL
jgi:hypothetical protein